MANRFLVLLYGISAYLIFLASVLYAIGFVGDFLVPKTINYPEMVDPIGVSLLVNVVLLSLFALQHSGMARPAFKKWWTRIVPRPMERSTYVLLSSLLLFLVFWQWRPLPAPVWRAEHVAGVVILYGVFAVGWLVVLASTFMIDHFDLFGLRQVWCYWQGREYEPPEFKEVWLYRYVRHPIMLGFLIAFWATPTMTVGHLFFAVVTTAYIFVGIWLEERDLKKHHGEQYESYRRETGMLLPKPRLKKPAEFKAPQS